MCIIYGDCVEKKIKWRGEGEFDQINATYIMTQKDLQATGKFKTLVKKLRKASLSIFFLKKRAIRGAKANIYFQR